MKNRFILNSVLRIKDYNFYCESHYMKVKIISVSDTLFNDTNNFRHIGFNKHSSTKEKRHWFKL